VLFALYLDEDLTEKNHVPVSLVPPSKPSSVLGPEFDPPQSDQLVADHDSAFGHEILDVTSTKIASKI